MSLKERYRIIFYLDAAVLGVNSEQISSCSGDLWRLFVVVKLVENFILQDVKLPFRYRSLVLQ